jgi:hypothetical protein
MTLRLTSETELREISGGAAIAVTNGGVGRAVVIKAADLPTCTWLVDGGTTEDGERWIHECGAAVVEFDNGYACTHGHQHLELGCDEWFANDRAMAQAEACGYLD